jgi:hypothetical protein
MSNRRHSREPKPALAPIAAEPARFEPRPFTASDRQSTPDVQPQVAPAGVGHDLSQVQLPATPLSIQAKLMVGPAGDSYEQEADRVAAQVLSMPVPDSAAAAAAGSASAPLAVQREGGGAGFAAGDDIERSIASQRGSGAPLPNATRDFMEPRFGSDFSSVRVHSDGNAHNLNQAIGARAFTTGQDIFFRQGEYQPSSGAGQELLAHELTHVVQQAGSVQRKPSRTARTRAATPAVTQTAAGQVLQAKLMDVKDFKERTSVKRSSRPKELEKVDVALKKIEQSGLDHILLTDLLGAIDACIAKLGEDSPRLRGVKELKREALNEQQAMSEQLTRESPPVDPSVGRKRRGAFSAKSAPGPRGKDYSDFDSKQYRISGRSPTRVIEEVKRTVEDDGTVVYYAMGLVTGFKGATPVVAPYPKPVSLGDWYPSVTHINGMSVAPKSGIMSAAAIQEGVNNVLDGAPDVALGQSAVDVLYTYSALRGGVLPDVWDCIKGKVRVDDEATGKQEEIMLDAVHRTKRVTVSAHSRGTIKTDNAVRNVHKQLSAEYLPAARSSPEVTKAVKRYLREMRGQDTMGIPIEALAEIGKENMAKEIAKDKARVVMDAYIQLIYAGNAVQHPSAILPISMFVGGVDPISMFVGTYSQVGSDIDSAIGTGGHKDNKVHSVGKGKGHGFVGNYAPSVSEEIAKDIGQRDEPPPSKTRARR